MAVPVNLAPRLYGNDATSTPNLRPRPPPLQPPKDVRLHYINVTPTAAPPSFPYPEPVHIWLSRDVSHEDWDSFVADLLDHSAETTVDDGEVHPGKKVDFTRQHVSHEDNTKRMHVVLAIWNEKFFQPRRLTVVASNGGVVRPARKRSASDKGRVWKLGLDGGKFGFQSGRGLFGFGFIGASKPDGRPKSDGRKDPYYDGKPRGSI